MPSGRSKPRWSKPIAKRRRTRGGDFEYPFPEKMPLLAPQSVVRRLRYVQDVDLNPPVGGAPAVNVFRANSCYDPDVTGGGSQPQGLDQYLGVQDGSGLYKNGIVLSSKCKVIFYNYDTAYLQSAGVTVSAASTAETSEAKYAMAQHTSSVWLAPEGASDSLKICTKVCDTAKFLGKRTVRNDSDMQFYSNGDTSTDNTIYYHVWVSGLGEDSANVKARVIIDYVIQFREPNLLALS